MQYERDPRTAFLKPYYINDSVQTKKRKFISVYMFGIFQLDLYTHHLGLNVRTDIHFLTALRIQYGRWKSIQYGRWKHNTDDI